MTQRQISRTSWTQIPKFVLVGSALGLALISSGCEKSDQARDGWSIERVFEIECVDYINDSDRTLEFRLTDDEFWESAAETTGRDGWLVVDATVTDASIKWSDDEYDHTIDRLKGGYSQASKNSGRENVFLCSGFE